MSLPPSVLKIKRKIDHLEPPETLQIQNTSQRFKQPRTIANLVDFTTDRWVFQRVVKKDAVKEVSLVADPWEQTVPEIRATQPGDEGRGAFLFGVPTKSSAIDAHHAPRTPLSLSKNSISQPLRRFHLTRAPQIKRQPSMDGVRKRRSEKAVATFVERIPASTLEAVLAGHEPDAINLHNSMNRKLEIPTPPKAQKKPGRNAGRGLKQAPPIRAKFDEVVKEEAARMQKLSMEIMASDPATQRPAPPTPSIDPRVPRNADLRFKPKAPAKRFRERHPPPPETQGSEADDAVATDSENEYVTDTYVRVPAHTLSSTPKTMGYLVIENDAELEAFCAYTDQKPDDSDNVEGESSDTNSERHHGNDYPEEESASDDDGDLDSYRYRADDEEYDLDEAHFSDDDPLPASMWDPLHGQRGSKSLRQFLSDDDDDDSEDDDDDDDEDEEMRDS